MGKALNNRNFGDKDGSIVAEYKIGDTYHNEYVVKQLSTRRYRFKSLMDDSIIDLPLNYDMEPTETSARILGAYALNSEIMSPILAPIEQINSKQMLINGRYVRWTNNITEFINMQLNGEEIYYLYSTFSDKRSFDGNYNTLPMVASRLVNDLPVMLLNEKYSANNFYTTYGQHTGFGLSFRYKNVEEIPSTSTGNIYEYFHESGDQLKLFYSYHTFGGSLVKDFSPSISFSKYNDEGEFVKSLSFSFSNGKWISYNGKSILSVDEISIGEKHNQGIFSLDSRSLKELFSEDVEYLTGTFKVIFEIDTPITFARSELYFVIN